MVYKWVELYPDIETAATFEWPRGLEKIWNFQIL